TNKWLAKAASRILLGNGAAAKFFEASKTKVTGNPVRDTLFTGSREKGLAHYGFSADKPVLFVTGGSLGALRLNNAMEKDLQTLVDNGIQVVWQCGKRYHEELSARVPKHDGIHVLPFIEDMANTFAVADLVVSRAGASTITELVLLNKPSILVPSPNVSEDHQTKNALSLVNQNASMMVKDVEANEKLVPTAVDILKDPKKLETLREGIQKVEKHDAAKEIVDEIYTVMNWPADS
ncbi:MAG: UDP-N-acetylglucosamine--N-acetylmuramyl-(pentapeptide) pyrophosphoryl-undecaprenol N-acetylglucosamine transferase, partial [Bacteroidota bacterium]